EFITPPRKFRGGDLRIEAFVDDVVDLAAEGIERGDRATALRRKEEKGVIEAGAARRGFLLTIIVGRHTARARSSGQSKARRTGRRRKTSYFACSIFSRMRKPPWIVARISRPMRPG